MKRLLLVLCLLSVPSLAAAQTIVVIGPSTLLAWDMPGMPPTSANACTYAVSESGSSFAPIIGPIICAAPVPPATLTACSVNLIAQSTITIGSGSITMTATCGGVTSLPSVPFAYVTIVIPIPANVRFR